MKLGPVHVIRDATFHKLRELQDLWFQVTEALGVLARQGNRPARDAWDQTHKLMHSPLGASVAEGEVYEPDPLDSPRVRDAVRRVMQAYTRARRDAAAPPAPSQWDDIGGRKAPFLAALEREDEPAVRLHLTRMFRSDLVWGLGQVHESHADVIRTQAKGSHLHARFADTLVSFAEAVGAWRVTSMEQDPAGHLRPLAADLDAVAVRALLAAGVDPSWPMVGGGYGFKAGGRVLSIDSLTHAYTPFRLRQLGVPADATIAEVGGGYGCLALVMARAGYRHYAVYDLPWVNALQGYFLIKALGPDAVKLYGEPGTGLRVLPYWKFDEVPAGSVDVAVNTDSLPEMGAATAAGYVAGIRRALRGVFFSVNQEACGEVPGVGRQNCVAELVAAHGGFVTLSRQRYWMRAGYVEEVFGVA